MNFFVDIAKAVGINVVAGLVAKPIKEIIEEEIEPAVVCGLMGMGGSKKEKSSNIKKISIDEIPEILRMKLRNDECEDECKEKTIITENAPNTGEIINVEFN